MTPETPRRPSLKYRSLSEQSLIFVHPRKKRGGVNLLSRRKSPEGEGPVYPSSTNMCTGSLYITRCGPDNCNGPAPPVVRREVDDKSLSSPSYLLPLLL